MEVDCPSVQSRREARRASRRDAILDCARQSFLEHGYAATTMSGIAAGLGGSKGTLWNYYASKELLFEAVLDRATQDFRDTLTVILRHTDDARSALHQFCQQFLAKLTQPDAVALFRLVVAEAGRFPELGERFFELGPCRNRSVLAHYIEGAMERGLMRRGDALSAALDLTGLCMSGCHLKMLVSASTAPDKHELEADAARAIDTFWRAWGPVNA